MLLDKGKCSIHPVRPTQCATYPFWSPHLASEVDWRATAATCEGITPQSRCKSESTQGSSGEPSAARAKQSAVQLIDEFRTSPQAGHGVTPPGKISPAQVRSSLFINFCHVHISGCTLRYLSTEELHYLLCRVLRPCSLVLAGS